MATGADVVPVLALISITMLGAFLADLFFRRTRIPDIPLLLGLGWLLGPFFGVVDPAGYSVVLNVLAALAITVVVLDAALVLAAQGSGTGEGVRLALAVFTATTLVVGGLLHLFIGFPLGVGFVTGAVVGGAGIVIVIPLVRTLGVGARATGVVTVEAVVADLFVVLAVFAGSAWLAAEGDTAKVAVEVVRGALIGGVLGVAAGAVWRWAIGRRGSGAEYEYVGTLAVLLAVYALTVALEGDAVLAVLGFGLVIGRSGLGRRMGESTAYQPGAKRPKDRLTTVFRSDRRLHHDVIFVVRAFFFVGVGIVIDWSGFLDVRLMLAGTLTAAGVALARLSLTPLVLHGGDWSRRDRTAVAIMFPLGLVAAVTSVVPWHVYGVPGTEDIPAVAAVAILLTNLFAATGAWALGRRPPAQAAS